MAALVVLRPAQQQPRSSSHRETQDPKISSTPSFLCYATLHTRPISALAPLQRGHPDHSSLPPPPQSIIPSRPITVLPLQISLSSPQDRPPAFKCAATMIKLQGLIFDCKTNPHAIGALDRWRRRRTRDRKAIAFKGHIPRTGPQVPEHRRQRRPTTSASPAATTSTLLPGHSHLTLTSTATTTAHELAKLNLDPLETTTNLDGLSDGCEGTGPCSRGFKADFEKVRFMSVHKRNETYQTSSRRPLVHPKADILQAPETTTAKARDTEAIRTSRRVQRPEETVSSRP
ncbi:hypothetical protein D9611_014750 [Ephemerocybe angulata]|uniref:Uncharacterized protein n=1 Tax=Ephemerocybe angulata TaxID=980116 RepID=A0A8H5EZL2_9AGAR|nr:hypothetical protein D9611_014750 [Tulosesus angulatus]